MNRKVIGYEYLGKFYDCEEDVNEAICEEIGSNYNNIDPMTTVEFEEVWKWNVETIYDLDVATKIVNEYIEGLCDKK